MKFIKSLILLIVALVAISNAADTTKYTGFKVKSLTAANPCNASPSEVEVSTCTSACSSIIDILPVANTNNQFSFQLYGAADNKCASAATSKVAFTCADSTSSVKINDDLSLVCVPQKSDSSDASSMIASLSLLSVGLVASLAL